MNRDGETYVKELEKKASRWEKMAKLQKRTVRALETVFRQKEVANKVVRIFNTRIDRGMRKDKETTIVYLSAPYCII